MRVMWKAWFCVSLIVVAADAVQARIPASVATTRTDPADTTRRSIGKAHALVGQEEWAAAQTQFTTAIASSGFDRLSNTEQYTALSQAGKLAVEHGDQALAHGWLSRATDHALASDGDWHRRLSAAYDLENYPDSALSIATIARRWPDTLDTIRAFAIRRVAARLENDPKQDGVRRELLDSLFDVRWTDDGIAPDGLWLDLVPLLLAQDKVDKAAIVAQRITMPHSVLALLVDRRFDALTARDGFNRDLDAVFASALRHAEARARAAPQQLKWRVNVQALLLGHRQFDSVIALADEVIARVNNEDGSAYYTDFDDEYRWILDQRARALQGLGRWDEALVQLRKASRRPENGGMNVSQSLNLGMLYAELEKPDEALEMIADMGPTSAYGSAIRESIALHAAVAKHDATAITQHLDYLREHRDDAIGYYQDALLLSDEVDAAALLLIERLRSERWRSDAILALQNYADVPKTPMAVRIRRQLDRVLALPRVRTELLRVGRIETVTLAPPGT